MVEVSDIRQARVILEHAVRTGETCGDLRSAIERALPLLDRKKPVFVARAQVKALTFRQKVTARTMREQGLPMHQIAIRLGTNHGRVSEAINEEL